MALVYPLLLFVIAWVVGGVGTIGDIRLLPVAEFAERLWRAGLLVFVSTIIGLGLNFFEQTQDAIEAVIYRLWGKSQQSTTLIARGAIRGVAFASAFAFAGAAAGAGAFAFAGAVAGAGAFTLVGAFAVGAAYALAGVGHVVFGFAGAGTFALAASVIVAFASRDSIVLFTFLAVLPLINAIFDWLSWAFTRYFLEKAETTTSGFKKLLVLVLHLMSDFAAALACLAGLAFSMGLALEAMNLGFIKLGWPQFDWTQQLYIAVHQPLTAGLAVTGMLLSTLVPTFIHLVVGLWGVFAVSNPNIKAAAAKISDTMSIGDRQSVSHSLLWHRDFKLVPAVLATCAIMCLPLLAIWHWHLPVAKWLTWLALTGARLVPAG
ncbi:MAG: hypothetical protein ACRDBH_13455 [Bosea sp. (in: a-proteobacteria)]